MFGFRYHHARNRSLIPVKDVKDVEVSEKMGLLDEEEIYEFGEEDEYDGERQEMDYQTPSQTRNLIMVYLLFLAEAIMASSLSTQIQVLVPSATACVGVDTSFLRSILQCAYFLGCAAGVGWGCLTDRWGRRRTAMLGLVGMCTCCLSMGFATTLQAMTVLRLVAGIASSAVTMSGLAMLADSTHGCERRVKAVARLPVVALGGGLGPLAAQMVGKVGDGVGTGLLARFPGLSAQIACAGLVGAVAIAEVMLLRETLPQADVKMIRHEQYEDCEKATFLGQSHYNDSVSSLNISIIEALADDTAAPTPSRLTLTQLLTAPSIILLVASYSLLSLHASTFETLLPQLSHTPSHAAGLAIPCAWLPTILFVVKTIAALTTLRQLPRLAASDLLPHYRRISLAFPLLYATIPLLALALHLTAAPQVIAATFNTFALLATTTLSTSASVLILLLILSAAPDASSTGTVVGVVSLSELFKSLTTGIVGLSYRFSDDFEVVVVNRALWAVLILVALVGAVVTRKLRGKGSRVGTDIPEECLVWEGVFDVDGGNEESGF